jgi:hypothetical protein
MFHFRHYEDKSVIIINFFAHCLNEIVICFRFGDREWNPGQLAAWPKTLRYVPVLGPLDKDLERKKALNMKL